MRYDSNTSSGTLIITSGDETDVAPAAHNGVTVPLYDIDDASLNLAFQSPYTTTNTSAQIGARANTTYTFYGVCRGWDDFRRS